MKKIISLVLVLVLALPLVACGGGEKVALRMYDGTFAEMKIVHRMVKFVVEEYTDLEVELGEAMSSVNMYKEMLNDKCDVFNSYDGTVLTTFLHLDVTDVPADETIHEYVNRVAEEQEGVYLLDKIGNNNTYSLAMPEGLAAEHGISTISELVPLAGEFVFGAEHEFFSEEGMAKFNPFTQFYGLEFKDVRQIDMNLKYAAVESGNVEVLVVYTTDGLNKKAQLRVLEDDRSYFPDYNGALLVRGDLFDRVKDVAPDLKEVLNKLGGVCNNEEMTELSYRVDVEEENVDDVTREFLRSKGVIS
ncbi:MAG: glycine betaine ABC transporter substrate-binding protein [Oscillospiraceae bacterium]